MLHIILTVLKITGLVILSIIGLILLLVILVLAAPISYEAKAGYDKDVSVLARVRLLYRILGVRFKLEEKKTKLEILIFGYVLGSRKKKKKKDQEESENDPSADDFEFDLESDDEITDSSEEMKPEETESAETESESEDKETENKEAEEEQSQEEATEDESGNSDQSVASVETYDADDASYEFSDDGISDEASEDDGKKKAGAMDYVRRIWDFLNRDSVQKLIGKLFRSIGKIIKHILPKSLDLSGEVGFEDPATTGKVMEVCAILYGLYGDHIRITSDFEEPKLKGEALLKGRIVPGYIVLKVLGMGIRIVLNKECRKLFHDIRHGL